MTTAAIGYAAETIALGDVGRVTDAGVQAKMGYRVLEESPQEESFHGTGLAEFHAYALLAAGYVDEAVAVTDEQYRRYADLPGMSRSMAIAARGMTALGNGDLAASRRFFRSAAESFGGYGEIVLVCSTDSGFCRPRAARSGDIDAALP